MEKKQFQFEIHVLGERIQGLELEKKETHKLELVKEMVQESTCIFKSIKKRSKKISQGLMT